MLNVLKNLVRSEELKTYSVNNHSWPIDARSRQKQTNPNNSICLVFSDISWNETAKLTI